MYVYIYRIIFYKWHKICKHKDMFSYRQPYMVVCKSFVEENSKYLTTLCEKLKKNNIYFLWVNEANTLFYQFNMW